MHLQLIQNRNLKTKLIILILPKQLHYQISLVLSIRNFIVFNRIKNLDSRQHESISNKYQQEHLKCEKRHQYIGKWQKTILTAITRNYCSCFCKTQCARAVAATAVEEVVCKYLEDRSKSFWKINFKILLVFPFIVSLFSNACKMDCFCIKISSTFIFGRKKWKKK